MCVVRDSWILATSGGSGLDNYRKCSLDAILFLTLCVLTRLFYIDSRCCPIQSCAFHVPSILPRWWLDAVGRYDILNLDFVVY